MSAEPVGDGPTPNVWQMARDLAIRTAVEQEIAEWIRSNPTLTVEREWYGNGRKHGGIEDALATAISSGAYRKKG